MLKTCLIVDDSPMIRKLAQRFLQRLDFDVLQAENGEIACAMCTTAMPNVILLDWNMPVMSGIEFLRRLRGMDQGNLPKVIFCTTENGVEYIREAFEAGTDEYIMKPFDSELLTATLAKVSAA